MIEYIVLIELIAAIFYLIAIGLAIPGFKKAPSNFQIVFGLIIIAMLLGLLISLMDVFEWAKIGPGFLVQGIEEIFTPMFAIVGLLAAYTAKKRYKK